MVLLQPRSSGREYNGELSVDDLSASPPLRKSVQSRLRQLRHRSASANRAASISTPDVSLTVSSVRSSSLCTPVGILYILSVIPSFIPQHADGASAALEQRVKLAELKAHLAEERAARNQTLLNHKLQEVNQLQHTLNSQTKVCSSRVI